jgi:dUTP pyrophosphatase
MIDKIPHIKIVRLYKDTILPARSNPTDSGFDLYVHNFKKVIHSIGAEESSFSESKYIILKQGWRALIGTGIQATVGSGFEIQIRSRSGLALNQGTLVANSPGTVDECFRGEIGVIIINTDRTDIKIEKGTRIAQMVVCPVILSEIEIVDTLDDTTRGAGGFGSTGV